MSKRQSVTSSQRGDDGPPSGGNVEGSSRQGAASGTGSVFSAVSSALGLDSGRAPAPQFNSKLEKDHYRLREDYKSLQDEYRRTERTLEKYALELQKTQYQLKTWFNQAKETQNKLQLSENAGKIDILQAFLDENVFALLSALDELKAAVYATSKFLDENIIFRASEAFPHEIESAQTAVLPFIGTSLCDALYTQANRASTTGSDARGSRLLVRLVSRAGACAYLDRAQKPVKAEILALYANIFKIASWVLPGAANRATFDKSLGGVLSAGQRVRSAKENIDKGLNVFIIFPLPGKTDSRYDPLQEEAVNVEGAPIGGSGDAHGDVVATLAFGLKRGDKVAMRSQVLLKSTLESALKQEEEELGLNIPLGVEQSDCDGRA
ncbi:hypothetical protein CPB83DRAFT_655121 [Crepidotus variabilis]|uniref:Uncharacterized protein n=1 Tax=Crepidotus variabilis TaxID=179855 RepID=A0A9P6E753_9AGAR|nr:hypothetical protein CPB83DRAFT_655121 [Crepidotus variabilis]